MGGNENRIISHVNWVISHTHMIIKIIIIILSLLLSSLLFSLLLLLSLLLLFNHISQLLVRPRQQKTFRQHVHTKKMACILKQFWSTICHIFSHLFLSYIYIYIYTYIIMYTNPKHAQIRMYIYI